MRELSGCFPLQITRVDSLAGRWVKGKIVTKFMLSLKKGETVYLKVDI